MAGGRGRVYVGAVFDTEGGAGSLLSRSEGSDATHRFADGARRVVPPVPRLSIEELWRRCFELGGMNSPLQLEAFVYGFARLTPHEHNLIAVAMNEYFAEFDPGQFVPYMENGCRDN